MAPTIELNDQVKGEHVETSDFFFDRIGKPVPVKPAKGGNGDSKLYDPDCLRSQPLAVSERFQLVFVALHIADDKGATTSFFLLAR